jgi:hypothetical protein
VILDPYELLYIIIIFIFIYINSITLDSNVISEGDKNSPLFPGSTFQETKSLREAPYAKLLHHLVYLLHAQLNRAAHDVSNSGA